MLKVQSSRRAAAMKSTDYDHEIAIVDNDGSAASGTPMERISTESRLLPPGQAEQPAQDLSDDASDTRIQERPVEELQLDQQQDQSGVRRLSIEVTVIAATPDAFHNGAANRKQKQPAERETVIDILYENERGGFLCGRPLFSAAALGGLDPTPWTNAYHKPSPTSIYTAQVPDPSWEWLWPEWHVNQQDGLDEGGWEYAFAFGKKFSWHGPRWYNSFVRRRAWTRMRGKKNNDDISVDPHMLTDDYFNVRPASDRTRRSQQSLASSRVASKTSLTQASTSEMEQVKPDIEDMETLLQTLRLARIDREKLEAMENYLKNAIDLSQLDNEMHEIMSLFIFQASRRALLSHLMGVYEETKAEQEKNDSAELRERTSALKDAAKHADEEVRKLAYWSDVKQMAEAGESNGAVDGAKGWPGDWQGLDQSGPVEPNKGKLPGP